MANMRIRGSWYCSRCGGWLAPVRWFWVRSWLGLLKRPTHLTSLVPLAARQLCADVDAADKALAKGRATA